MRGSLSRACAIAAMLALPSATAVAEFTDISGTKHIEAFVEDAMGLDSFSTTEPIAFGDDLLVDHAKPPGGHTFSGAALFTSISSSHIEANGDILGGGGLDSGVNTISAEATFSVTFMVIGEEKAAYWDVFTLALNGATVSVTLTGPGGVLPEGKVFLEPGAYSIEATTSYAAFIDPGDDNILGRFQITLENIPAPGTLGVLAIAGTSRRSRRRRMHGPPVGYSGSPELRS